MNTSARSSEPLQRRVAAALCLALFTVSFNVNMMTVLMIPITRDLDTNLGTVQNGLVLASLTAFAFVPTSQRLGSVFGHKRMFVVGLAVFALGLAATAASRNVLMLILSFGIVVGVGATPLVTLPWMLVSRAFTGLKREIGFLALTMSIVSGALVGPTFGGLLNTTADWHWAFLSQLVLIGLAWVLVRPASEIVENPDEPIDLTGAVLSFSGLALIVLGVNLSSEYGWWRPLKTIQLGSVSIPPFALSIVPIVIAVGAILLLIFALPWRRRAQRSDKTQMWQLGVLRQRRFGAGLVVSAFFAIASAGLTYTLFLFLQASGTFQLTSFDAAIAALPYNIAMVLVLLATFFLGRWIAPKYLIQLGLLVAIVGLWTLVGSFQPGATTADLIPGLVVTGIGAGLVVGQMAPLTLSVIGDDGGSEARGVFNSVQDLSFAVGISAYGLLLVYLMSAALVDGVTEADGLAVSDQQRTELIREVQDYAETMTRDELDAVHQELGGEGIGSLDSVLAGPENDAMQRTLVAVAAVMAIGLGVSAFLPRHRLEELANSPGGVRCRSHDNSNR